MKWQNYKHFKYLIFKKMWTLFYSVAFWLAYKYTGIHVFVNPYFEKTVEYILPMYEKYMAPHLAPFIEKVTPHYYNLQDFWQYFQLRASIVYNMLRIVYLDWLDLVSITDTRLPDVKWLNYKLHGEQYRIPFRVTKGRGPSTPDETLDRCFGPEVRGPFGDYHGQQQLLQSMSQTSERISLDEVFRSIPR